MSKPSLHNSEIDQILNILRNTIFNSALIILTILSASINLIAQIDVVILDVEADETSDLIYCDREGETESFLINRCGEIVNSWSHSTRPGLTGFLTNDGFLLRSGKLDGCCPQASNGGLIELIDYDGDVAWSAEFADDTIQQHHDLTYLPNGNILFLGWEILSLDKKMALGKDNPDRTLWSEFIYEVEPVGDDEFNIVWEWHLEDHLVQDEDSTLTNFVKIDTALGKIDINYAGPFIFSARDWWHVNAIDYNEERDEVLINSRSNGELWIIDHSTTTEEASGDLGGNHNKGGQLLFRWGNPEAYGKGTADDYKMYGAHGHHWIGKGLPDEGKILFFNNGDGRPGIRHSTIEMIDPELDIDSKYIQEADEFRVSDHKLIYGQESGEELFYSIYMSNAEQLPSGGFLINATYNNRIFQINTEREIVWEANWSAGFKAHLYSQDFSGFENATFNYGSQSESFSSKIVSDGDYACGETIVVLSSSANFDDIMWSTGESTDVISVTEAGEYYFEYSSPCHDTLVRSDVFELMALLPPESQTKSVAAGDLCVFEITTALNLIEWFDSETSLEPIGSGTGIVLENITSDSTVWVRVGLSQACVSERAPFYVKLLVSANENLAEQAFNVYPNPAKNEVLIESQIDTKTIYQLINLQGQELLSSENNRIDLSSISPGCYFVRMLDENGKMLRCEKIVKL